jgi:hypothetical protein
MEQQLNEECARHCEFGTVLVNWKDIQLGPIEFLARIHAEPAS